MSPPYLRLRHSDPRRPPGTWGAFPLGGPPRLVLDHLSGQLRLYRRAPRHSRRPALTLHLPPTWHGLYGLSQRSQENQSSLVPRLLLSRSGCSPCRFLPGLPLRLDLPQVDQRTPRAFRATPLGLVPTPMGYIPSGRHLQEQGHRFLT